ncbi:hypothetical protein AWB67_07378 [Caballeronia terrestris]|uniref:Uncharacterized protein n=1 Tax=Caballeronia terrestris TaxID=1226301 RepID=A0A158L2M9_9BURK|nr:hypothetical protein AWB67_07378 [Caballeronia terrestris]
MGSGASITARNTPAEVRTFKRTACLDGSLANADAAVIATTTGATPEAGAMLRPPGAPPSSSTSTPHNLMGIDPVVPSAICAYSEATPIGLRRRSATALSMVLHEAFGGAQANCDTSTVGSASRQCSAPHEPARAIVAASGRSSLMRPGIEGGATNGSEARYRNGRPGSTSNFAFASIPVIAEPPACAMA